MPALQKAVITTSAILLVVGTVLIRHDGTDHLAGRVFYQRFRQNRRIFHIFPWETFTNAGLLTVTVLMFYRGFPFGSTGGGIKTSTLFTLFHTIRGAATNGEPRAFHYQIPPEAFYKAAVVSTLSMLVVCAGSFAMCVLEPGLGFMDILFEITSAFRLLVGLSTGITTGLGPAAKLLRNCGHVYRAAGAADHRVHLDLQAADIGVLSKGTISIG